MMMSSAYMHSYNWYHNEFDTYTVIDEILYDFPNQPNCIAYFVLQNVLTQQTDVVKRRELFHDEFEPTPRGYIYAWTQSELSEKIAQYHMQIET